MSESDANKAVFRQYVGAFNRGDVDAPRGAAFTLQQPDGSSEPRQ